MATNKQKEISIDERYREERQPDKRARYSNWSAAKGLQAVDGLTTSAYLEKVAGEQIEGKYDAERAKELIDSYYQTVASPQEQENHAEADRVAARINILISEKSFTLSTEELLSIHQRLFDGVFPFAGQIRKNNIAKDEWVLMGDTVIYGDAYHLRTSLDSCLKKERFTSFASLDDDERIAHFARFCAEMWQLHPFSEGNTRTTAVFMIKYLRKLGYEIDNSVFQNHSRYFRDALVRANYANLKQNFFEEYAFLEAFFSDLLYGTKHDLRSRLLLIQPDGPLVLRQEHSLEQGIQEMIASEPGITRQEMADRLGVSVKTVERRLKSMGLVHGGANKKGKWQKREPSILRSRDGSNSNLKLNL